MIKSLKINKNAIRFKIIICATIALLLPFFFFGIIPSSLAQSNGNKLLTNKYLKNKKIYRNLDKAFTEPEKVYSINFIKSDLKRLPPAIGKLKNLKVIR